MSKIMKTGLKMSPICRILFNGHRNSGLPDTNDKTDLTKTQKNPQKAERHIKP